MERIDRLAPEYGGRDAVVLAALEVLEKGRVAERLERVLAALERAAGRVGEGVVSSRAPADAGEDDDLHQVLAGILQMQAGRPDQGRRVGSGC
ncbi:MAG: hypothetical protein QME87_13710 [Bacillota bacterium]|nr:hypothetical protein [Bacillota bacterium]